MSWERIVPGGGGVAETTARDQIVPGVGGLTASSATDVTVTPVGVSVSVSVGTVTALAATIVVPTGASVTASAGTATPRASVTVIPESAQVAVSVGTVVAGAGIIVVATGVGVTASAGSVTAISSVAVTPTGVGVTAQAGVVTVADAISGLTSLRVGFGGRGFFGMFAVENGQGSNEPPSQPDLGSIAIRVGGKFGGSTFLIGATPQTPVVPGPTADAGAAGFGFGLGFQNTTSSLRYGTFEMVFGANSAATVEVIDKISIQGPWGFGLGFSNTATGTHATTSAFGFGLGFSNSISAGNNVSTESAYFGFGLGFSNEVASQTSVESSFGFGLGFENTFIAFNGGSSGGGSGASVAEIVSALHANPPPLTPADLSSIQAAVVAIGAQLAQAHWDYSLGPNHTAKAVMRLVGAATFGKGVGWKFSSQWQNGDNAHYYNIEGTKPAITYEWNATADRFVKSTDPT